MKPEEVHGLSTNLDQASAETRLAELGLYQIALEAQKEELLFTRLQLEASHKRTKISIRIPVSTIQPNIYYPVS